MVGKVIIVILLSIEALVFSMLYPLGYSLCLLSAKIAEALERRNKDGKAD